MKFHLLTIADTHDPNIGEGCGYDVDGIEQMMREAADLCDVDLESQTIRGEHYTYRVVANALHALEPEPDDLVMIWYSGHGFRTPSKKERWPYLAFPSSPFEAFDGMGTDEIFRLLAQRKPRLLIVMSDCCNSLVDTEIDEHLSSRSATNSDHARRNYRALFCEARGTIIATSSQPGEYSIGTTEGGWFTMAFSSVMRKKVWNARKTNWKTILNAACVPLQCDSNTTGYQTPIYDLNVGARVRSWTQPRRKRRKKLKAQSVEIVNRSLDRPNLKLLRLSWLAIALAACLGAGTYFERVPLAVDGAAAILAAFVAWRGYHLGFLETVGQMTSVLAPIVGSLWLFRPAERLLQTYTEISFPYMTQTVYGVIAVALFGLLRWGFHKLADGHHASLLDALAGTAFGALLGGLAAYAAVLGTLWSGQTIVSPPDLTGSEVAEFATSHNLFETAEFQKTTETLKSKVTGADD